MTEGYGPNAEAIEGLVKDGAKLIVTVDCGTTSIDALAVARPLGADVIVVDHHQADERLPDVAALVNPNRQDDMSGLGHLCAAGVVFMLLVATARELRTRGLLRREVTPPDLLDSARSGGAGDRLRRGASQRPEPRLCHQRPAGHAPAPQHRSQGPQRRRRARRRADAPTIWASCWAPASTRAAASAMRRWARGCCRSTTRPKPRASPSCSTSSIASARPSRRRCWTRPWRMPITWSRPMPACRC